MICKSLLSSNCSFYRLCVCIIDCNLCFSVSFDLEALGGEAAEKVSPAEGINYFCDIKMEEELERVRSRPREKTRPVQAKDNSRNTVLILPKIQRFVRRKIYLSFQNHLCWCQRCLSLVTLSN